MESLYAELSVDRRTSTFGYFIKALCVSILILLVGIVVLLLAKTGQVFVAFVYAPFIVGLIGIMYVVFPRLKAEYEYIYCDDRLDIARILGKTSRKNMLRIEMDVLEFVAPVNSEKLDEYKNLPVKDFSSRKKKDGKYAIITMIKDRKTKVIFEPSDKIIECMYFKAPRKIVKA